MTDFHADFGQRHSDCCGLQLAHPRVQLFLAQRCLQSRQGFHIVGQDEYHRGLLMSQGHAQDGQLIGFVIIEFEETLGSKIEFITIPLRWYFVSLLMLYE